MPHKPVLGLPMKWKFCPSSENASDLGSHWASIVKSKQWDPAPLTNQSNQHETDG